jgi:hypothetical protein
MNRSDHELRGIRDSVAWIGRLSDNLVRVGPFSLGVDGVLSWVPGIGELYSTVAGGFIVVQGIRAGVPIHILAGAAAILSFRTAVSAVPIAGSAFADIFAAHKWAAAMVVKAIDHKLSRSWNSQSHSVSSRLQPSAA